MSLESCSGGQRRRGQPRATRLRCATANDPLCKAPLGPWGRRHTGCAQLRNATWSVTFVESVPRGTRVLGDPHVGPSLFPLATRRCGRPRAKVEPNESSDQRKMPPKEEVAFGGIGSPGRSNPSDIFAFLTRILRAALTKSSRPARRPCRRVAHFGWSGPSQKRLPTTTGQQPRSKPYASTSWASLGLSNQH